MSAESPRHARSGGPLTVAPQPPSDRGLIDAVSGFINDVTLSSSSNPDPKDVIQWARFETADINEPSPDSESTDVAPLLLVLGYGSGVQVWLIPPNGEAQEVLSWRQGTVRVLRILPSPTHGDSFAVKRPLIALCDSASPGPTFCSLSFISIKGGEQVKSIKFKNPILDVLANKRSVVVSFSERFAVFDAGTLEDRMAITTCYPCPCPLGGSAPINPLALGERWLAFADKKLNQSKRSSGGCEGEGVASYTATVLHAAKSLGKGLRGLGESVAQSLSGRGASPPRLDVHTPGVVTLIDIEGNNEENTQDGEEPYDPIVAHFVAHSEAIIALSMDASGMLLVTADRRGHDFHVFRVNPHPCGPSLASVHHLYVLHRGDTTAKVQDIALSRCGRWAGVSTLRGTTHVFALSPYGGACGVRTHTQARVVNRLSRFHRSAGLPLARSSSPVTITEGLSPDSWFPNPRLPPLPSPCTGAPLAQLRPTAAIPTHTITRTSSGRQRLSSLSEEGGAAPLLARAQFGGWSCGAGRPSLALYLVTHTGTLLHLVLQPRAVRHVPKEKICEETPIELEVEPVSQWRLQRPPNATDLLAPLPAASPLLQQKAGSYADMCASEEERWLAQVEIVTHAGPHRRLWMGPQFVFKTYTSTGSNSSLSEAETVEIETSTVARSNPVNMPGVRPIVPVLIDSGSASSLEHSPSDSFRRKSLLAETGRAASVCDVQLKEDLAEAMKEDTGCVAVSGVSGRGVARAVGPRGEVSGVRDGAATETGPLVTSPSAPPRTTRIPAQSAPAPPTPVHSPHALPSDVIIPAALSRLPQRFEDDGDSDVSVQCVLSDYREEVPFITEKTPVRDFIESHVKIITPAEEVGDMTPVVDAKESKPLKEVKERTPVKEIKARTPIMELKERTPVKEVKEQTPIQEVKEQTPIKEVKERTPIKEVKERTPIKEVKERTPIKEVKERTPIKEVKERIPIKEVKERTPIKEVKERTPVKNRDHTPTVIEIKESVEEKTPIKEIKENTVQIIKENTPKLDDAIEIDADERKTSQKINEVKRKSQEKSLKKVVKSSKGAKENVGIEVVDKIRKETKLVQEKEVYETPFEQIKDTFEENNVTEDVSEIKEETSFVIKLPETPREPNVKAKLGDDEIKTEEQAWNLLNEPDDEVATLPIEVTEKVEVPKPKSKRNRKSKKVLEDNSSKEDDSFVEIYTTDDKQQDTSGELVTISSPYEDSEISRQFYSKRRSPKSLTPERTEYLNREYSYDLQEPQIRECAVSPHQTGDEPILVSKDNKDIFHEFSNIEIRKDGTSSETTSLYKEVATKTKKSKSLSPYLDQNRKLGEKIQSEAKQKDLIIINTIQNDFPEIQITKGPRKKSPQAPEIKIEEKVQEPIIEKPAVKSWSSIAASKSKKIDVVETKQDVKIVPDESYSTFSLQDKLIELCKRTDIMVAECDEPTELNFVDEHVLTDLPPLEVDFALDDFKLEVMKDSLLETDTKVTSPICKINIDDILSSIKETTNRVIESSTFNLVDLEEVPMKREKGFNIVEREKITTQEIDIKLNEEKHARDVVENSDDENTSPLLSTDSDKDKTVEALSSVPMISKQSAKSKKSRRKKK